MKLGGSVVRQGGKTDCASRLRGGGDSLAMPSDLQTTFDRWPLDKQPAVLAADCTDRAQLLSCAYKHVRDHTMRGQWLGEYPLLLVYQSDSEAAREDAATMPREAQIPCQTTAQTRVEAYQSGWLTSVPVSNCYFLGGNEESPGMTWTAPPTEVPILVDALATTALIAVASCTARWPGSVAQELRGIIDASGDAVTRVPHQRWDVSSSLGHLSEAQNDSVRHGGFLGGAERFDNVCFAVSSAEATVMDPQQRLLLETGYASFAGAHLRRAALMHSGLGVYLGIMNVDHQLTDVGSKSVLAATCRSSSIAAGRLSFTLGLNGACQSVDTACSSALVATHAASAGMVLGDHGGALCASVSLILSPVASVYYAQATMLSADGRCKTLDARANGYSRAEGVCAVFLTLGDEESVGAAVKLGGSAVRQDGRSASLTAPNGSAQLVLIRQAMDRASTMPEQVHRQMKPCPW